MQSRERRILRFSAHAAVLGLARPGSTPASAQGTCQSFEGQTLRPADQIPDNRFGHSVAMFGVAAVAGAFLDDDQGVRSGSVYPQMDRSRSHRPARIELRSRALQAPIERRAS